MTILDSIARSLGFARPAKAETGPGVIPMMYDRHMSSLFEKDDQAKALAAQAIYRVNPWVNAAERAVVNAFANVGWHLEDEDDHEIGDESSPEQKAALDLLEHPQAALKKGETQYLTRRSLWTLTGRHMGLCGTSFWLGDGMSLDKIPTAFLYVNPARMTPVNNPAGYVIGWRLDAKPYDPDSGYPLGLDEVIQFTLDPADAGAWGIGLAETSGILSELWMLAARHSGGVLSSGGRIAGITMPKPGTEMSDEAWVSLVRDMRTISEDPQAAKRNLIIKKPMDFLATAASPRELDLIASLAMSRDDILGFWGVPKSQIGMDVPSGLNSGTLAKDRDKAVLWEGAVHARLTPFAEVIQAQILDRWKARGVTLELEIEEPDFTEEKPKYEIAALALSQPLRNRERRAILGLDPFGDPALDEAVWMPLSITSQYTAPDAEGRAVEPLPEPEPPPAPEPEPPILPEGKADTLRPLLGLRRAVNVKWTPQMQAAVEKVLAAQRVEIARRLIANAAHIEAKPSDTAAWWDENRWDAAMLEAVKPYVSAITETVADTVADVLAPTGKAGTHVWAQPLFWRLLKAIGKRIVDINRTTRDRVQELIMAGIDEGQGPAQLGKTIREGVPIFNELRAETIARTETMRTFNSAALQSYAEMGVTHVQPIDGDKDDMCRERIARGAVTLEEADADEEHPNGTLDWIPYYEGDDLVEARVQETPP